MLFDDAKKMTENIVKFRIGIFLKFFLETINTSRIILLVVILANAFNGQNISRS